MATITIGRKLNYLADSVTAAQGPSGGQPWLVAEQNTLVPAQRDYIELTYHLTKTDLPVRAVYKVGGPTGIITATVEVTYDAYDNVATVWRH